MTTPKYVQEILRRSRYEFDYCTKNENYSAGYTLRIRKATPCTQIDTLKAEVERLCAWANRQSVENTAVILYIPKETHYHDQAAVVTIFDPVMQKIERYIPKK